jgi:hypothetical protein
MKRTIVLAAALTAFGVAQAQEATPWDLPAPSPGLTRADVLAELREWRQAGAWVESNEAGPGDAVLERRVAMNRLAAERYARAQALEQQRLAAEAAAREQARLEAEARQREQMLAQSAPAAGPEGTLAAPSAEMASPGGDTPAPPDSGRVSAPEEAIIDSRGTPPGAPLDARSIPPQAPPPRETSPQQWSAPAETPPQPDSTAIPQPEATAQPEPQTRPAGDNAYGYREPADKYGQPPLETEPATAKPVQ